MAITVECPQCGRRYEVPDTAAGRLALCKPCGIKIQIPGIAPPAPAATEALPKQMIANRLIAGRVCPICKGAIDLGQAVRNCELCGKSHHEMCWNGHGGCGTASCGNAPLPEITKPAQEPAPPPGVWSVAGDEAAAGYPGQPAYGIAPAAAGTKPCPYCGESIAAAAIKCRFCGQYLTALGMMPGVPARTCGTATAAMVLGICATVFSCAYIGVILGPIAIGLASSARRKIREGQGALTGSGMATAGLVTGIIGTIICAIEWIVVIVAVSAG